MVLRFEVNQAEAFRQGVDVEKSTNHLEIDPSKLPEDERNLIADRLTGIDVCWLQVDNYHNVMKAKSNYDDDVRHRIVAKLPTYEALLEAIRANQGEIEAELREKPKMA
jgi:hypothetical protein